MRYPNMRNLNWVGGLAGLTSGDPINNLERYASCVVRCRAK
jgi:hypothetical protein